MPNPFDQHLEGCAPTKPCANCLGLEYIEKHLHTQDVMNFLSMLAHCDGQSMNEIFGGHMENCSPAMPCPHCKAYTFLKDEMSKMNSREQNICRHGKIDIFAKMFITEVPVPPAAEEIAEQERQATFRAKLEQKIDSLELSFRSAVGLKNDHIVLIGDLCTKTETEILRIPNLGRKSLNEIKEVLDKIGLRLGMEIPNWA